MAEITGGELLLRCVQREGIEFVIGITDEGYHTIQHHCADYGFRHVAPRHEAAAAHIAQGIFKTSGAMSLVLAGGGPGTANVLSGVICALAEGVPMFVVTAQRRADVVYPSKPGIFQAMDQQEMFRPMTKWNAVVHQWERIPEIVSRAFREALAGRPGPVHIDMTDTIMNATGDDSSVEVLDPAQYRSTVPAEPTLSEIAHLVDLIRDARCPVLMAGVGVLNSEGWGEFRELVELLDCPPRRLRRAAARVARPVSSGVSAGDPDGFRLAHRGWPPGRAADGRAQRLRRRRDSGPRGTVLLAECRQRLCLPDQFRAAGREHDEHDPHLARGPRSTRG